MSEEREKVRCRECELVQWKDQSDCRRCGSTLPCPIVKIVDKVVFEPCSRCDQRLDGSVPAGAAGLLNHRLRPQGYTRRSTRVSFRPWPRSSGE